MWKVLGLVSLQTIFLSGGQVLLKLAMEKMTKFEWTWAYFKSVLTNWWFLACGISFGVATVLWLYILKKFPFSQAYPLTSLSFVFDDCCMVGVWRKHPLVTMVWVDTRRIRLFLYHEIDSL